MNTYKRHRFPPDITFMLSGPTLDSVTVTETSKIYSPSEASPSALKRNHHGHGDTFYVDEVCVKINDSNSICGGPWIEMVKSSMCISSLNGMVL